MRIHVVGLSIALAAMVAAAHAQAPGGNAPAHGGAMMMSARHRSGTATAFVVQFKVKPGKNAAFEKAFREMEAKVRENEPGNLSYDLYRAQLQLYVVVERYKDQAAVAAHGRDARNLMADLKDSLDGAPQFQALTLVSSK